MTDILFLDIDGVLNRRGTTERCDAFIGVDRGLARRLTGWIRQRALLGRGVHIVLSSTWRLHADMHTHLHEAGIHWIDITPQHYSGPRGAEIEAWLEENSDKWNRYAILDDDADMLASQQPLLVKTDTDVGLQDEHIEKLNDIFSVGSQALRQAA